MAIAMFLVGCTVSSSETALTNNSIVARVENNIRQTLGAVRMGRTRCWSGLNVRESFAHEWSVYVLVLTNSAKIVACQDVSTGRVAELGQTSSLGEQLRSVASRRRPELLVRGSGLHSAFQTELNKMGVRVPTFPAGDIVLTPVGDIYECEFYLLGKGGLSDPPMRGNARCFWSQEEGKYLFWDLSKTEGNLTVSQPAWVPSGGTD